MINTKLRDQFIRFAVVGGICTAVSYSIFITLTEFTQTHYLVASTVGFLAGLVTGFYINKNWTFAKEDTNKIYFLKYFLVYLFSLVVNLLILEYLVESYEVPKMVAQVIATGTTVFSNFFGSKILVFKA
ncbi:MAG: GtrA family protein [Sporocytophaga sp.]|uniref:GtrA family protein n=1 Tax=Sporocytophaga sp. TaxID=2231183 RepID=UPI001B10704A|nr:GtrA family protein [Sporocytophaga sp.]MBO9701095.1 GtrA family protein [Sporocytophaga sp.]